jgi:hypothetical protein
MPAHHAAQIPVDLLGNETMQKVETAANADLKRINGRLCLSAYQIVLQVAADEAVCIVICYSKPPRIGNPGRSTAEPPFYG